MAIQPVEPIIIPAKTADKLWIVYLNVNSQNPTSPANVFIRLAPYSSETGEIFNDYAKVIEIPDLFAAAAKDEVLANAIGTLFNAIEKLAKDRGIFGVVPQETPIIPVDPTGPDSVVPPITEAPVVTPETPIVEVPGSETPAETPVVEVSQNEISATETPDPVTNA